MVGHPAGVLEFDHHPTACTLRTFEDMTRVADSERHWLMFRRPATPTERLLLTALGYAVPAALDTLVTTATPGIRRREWADLRPIAVAA